MIGASKDAWLIVGLGNPGREYENSRHNCGFRAIDRLAGRLGCKIDKAKFQGLYGKTQYGGKPLYLLKPLTYMNLSGQSVLQLSAYFQIPPQRIIVLFDDISLEPGRLRVRAEGSAGGHNGIKSVIAQLGSEPLPSSTKVYRKPPTDLTAFIHRNGGTPCRKTVPSNAAFSFLPLLLSFS